VPMVPFLILTWIGRASGAFMLESYTDLGQVGLFTLASQFAGLTLMASVAFDNALMPHFLERAGKPGADKELGLLVTRYIGFFGLISLGIIIVAVPTILIVALPDYHGATRYVAPLIFANWIFVARQPFIWSFIYSVRSDLLSLVQGLSTALLIGLLIIFLGVWDLGIMGVIYATIVSNVSFVILGYVISRYGFFPSIPWTRFAMIIVVLIVAGILMVNLNSYNELDIRNLSLQLIVFALAVVLTARLTGLTNFKALLRAND
jgi:O-antigen/teichoic acid export membrane protein